jgi:ATP-binding cassette subfamily B protein
VLQFTRPYKTRFAGSIALAVVLAAFTPVRPFLIQYTVDKYIANADRTFVDNAIEALMWITVFQ